jgi:hypothetical protein
MTAGRIAIVVVIVSALLLMMYCCWDFLAPPAMRAKTWPIRWALFHRVYEGQINRLPDPQNGTLKHIEWDGWGFPGAGNTVVYLVFDPKNSLYGAAKSGTPGKYNGVPCEVYRVRQLASHWYTVHFYTQTDWGHCE